MSNALDKLMVRCPHCGKGLSVPTSSAGKSARCPMCKLIFRLPDLMAMAAPSVPPMLAPLPSEPYPAYDPQVATGQGSAWVPPPPPMQPFAPETTSGLPAINPGSSAVSNANKYNHGFGWEHRGWDAGMLGGILMMLIAAVWFVVGLGAGYIFFYPPILFLIGFFGFVRGMFSGNVAGRRRR